MDDSDEKKLYEVAELQEYQEGVGFKENPSTGNTTARQHLLARLTPLLHLILLVIVILIVILQSATIYLVMHTPESTTATTTTSAVTGADNTGCNVTTELLKLLNQIVNNTQDITSFNDIQMQYIQNSTNIFGDNLEITQETAQQLSNIIETLSILKGNSITTEGVVNDILLLIEALLEIQNTSLAQNPKSCQEIKNSQPNSTSGYYHINSQIVYCEMEELCSTEGGWTRLGYLDMTDSTVDCPPGFNLFENNGVRACNRPGTTASCESIKFLSNGISYSEVCGRVVGYQYGSTDGVDTRFISLDIHNDINSYYVDGVSITQGFPRKHVWTMMSGVSSSIPDAGNCICNDPPGSTQQVQSFIGNDYFCESGNPAYWSFVFYSNDPLWDGEGCGSQEGNCCAVTGLPWFHKTLNSTTTDYIELRLCGDQSPSDEDVPIALYEIFVK